MAYRDASAEGATALERVSARGRERHGKRGQAMRAEWEKRQRRDLWDLGAALALPLWSALLFVVMVVLAALTQWPSWFASSEHVWSAGDRRWFGLVAGLVVLNPYVLGVLFLARERLWARQRGINVEGWPEALLPGLLSRTRLVCRVEVEQGAIQLEELRKALEGSKADVQSLPGGGYEICGPGFERARDNKWPAINGALRRWGRKLVERRLVGMPSAREKIRRVVFRTPTFIAPAIHPGDVVGQEEELGHKRWLAGLPFPVRGYHELLSSAPTSSCTVRVKVTLRTPPRRGRKQGEGALEPPIDEALWVCDTSVHAWEADGFVIEEDIDCQPWSGASSNRWPRGFVRPLLDPVLVAVHETHPIADVTISRA